MNPAQYEFTTKGVGLQVVKKVLLVLAALILLGGLLGWLDVNANRSVSFTLCSAPIEKYGDGTQSMTAVTSAGSFFVTDPSLIRVLGGDKPKIGEKFDGEYDGGDIVGKTHQLKKASLAKEPSKVSPCSK